MQGELLGEATGKITATRVEPANGRQIEVEVSFQGTARFLGEECVNLGSYVQTMRQGGALYGEGHVLVIAADGEVLNWNGFGVGRPTGKPPAGQFAVCGSIQTTAERFQRLNSIANLAEYEVDEDGTYRWRMWEWVPASVPAPTGVA